jgi:hypothetical protein
VGEVAGGIDPNRSSIKLVDAVALVVFGETTVVVPISTKDYFCQTTTY